MSGRQKAALIASCVLYVVTIFGFFFLGIIPIVIFFLLFSLCILYFAYLCFEMHNDYTGAEHLQQEIGLLKAENESIRKEYEDKLEAKEGELRKSLQNAEDLANELSNLEKKKEDAEKALSEQTLRDAEKDHVMESLLPPDDDDVSEVDIILIAHRAIDELAEAEKEANLKVTVSSASERLMVKASAKRLLIMFRNIIDNSIKYMQRAGTLVITISAIEDDIFIVLKDTGKGLPEDETKHIFELNYQGSNRISGNGLGLTQAKAIVEHYGGTIYARSPGGNGMGIYIQLPAKTV